MYYSSIFFYSYIYKYDLLDIDVRISGKSGNNR
jgi:hypothetical protein